MKVFVNGKKNSEYYRKVIRFFIRAKIIYNLNEPDYLMMSVNRVSI